MLSLIFESKSFLGMLRSVRVNQNKRCLSSVLTLVMLSWGRVAKKKAKLIVEATCKAKIMLTNTNSESK